MHQQRLSHTLSIANKVFFLSTGALDCVTHSFGSAYDIRLECPGSKAADSFANKVYNSSGLIPSPFLCSDN